MLILHIIAGSFVLLCGFAALYFSKGQYLHRLSGNIFFFSLLIIAGSAAFLTDDPTMAVLSAYYASTGWVTVLRPAKTSGVFEILAMIAIVFVSASLFRFVITADSLDPVYAVIFLAHATIAALAACLDLNMILRGGLSGKHRMVRHAWRMCFALLGAVLSFTANTAEYWPDYLDSNLLIYLTLGILFYWIVRLMFTKWYEKSKSSFGKNIFLKRISAKQNV